MYGMLWRTLPGHWLVRALILTVAVTAILTALDAIVFPWTLKLLFLPDGALVAGQGVGPETMDA